MGVLQLDHFTIRTEQWAETAEFFEHVIGLTPGPRPGFRFPGCWMYAAGHPLLHIASVQGDPDELKGYLGDKPGGFGAYRDGLEIYARAASKVKELVVVEGSSHYELYDQPAPVGQALAKLIPFFQKNL